jgi:hypothetical protein
LSHEVLAWDGFVRLVSLWEVLKTYAFDFAEMQAQLASPPMAIVSINAQFEQSGAGELHVDTSALGEWVDRWVKRAIELSKELNLRASYELAVRIDSDRPWVGERFAQEIKDLRSRIEDELKAANFLYIPLSKMEFYEPCVLRRQGRSAIHKRYR